VHAAHRLDFNFDELCTLALNGFESAFLPWEERVQLLEEVSEEMAAMAEELV
jgi:adenosine deaminase